MSAVPAHAPTPAPAPEAALVRAIGTWELAASIANVIVGASVYVLPAAIAAALGTGAPIGYIACGAVMWLVMLCFAECGSRTSRTGGPYMYVEAAFGPYIGFLAGTLFWLSNVLASGGIASALADVAGVANPFFAKPAVRVALIVACYLIIVATNIRGVKHGTWLNVFTMIAKLTPLILFIVAGAFFIHADNLRITHLPSISEIGPTAILLIFAFSGMETALSPSGEVRTPARTVPRALVLALALITVLYIAVQLTAQGILGAGLAQSKAALAEASRRITPSAGIIVTLGALASMFGFMSGDVLGSSRLLFAFARDRVLPAWLTTIHPRFRTPHYAIVTHATIACALALSGTFTELAILSTIAVIVLYLACCLAVLELRRRGVRADGAPFVLPGGPLIPVVASLALLWILVKQTPREILVTVATLVVASLIFLVSRLRRRARNGDAMPIDGPDA